MEINMAGTIYCMDGESVNTIKHGSWGRAIRTILGRGIQLPEILCRYLSSQASQDRYERGLINGSGIAQEELEAFQTVLQIAGLDPEMRMVDEKEIHALIDRDNTYVVGIGEYAYGRQVLSVIEKGQEDRLEMLDNAGIRRSAGVYGGDAKGRVLVIDASKPKRQYM